MPSPRNLTPKEQEIVADCHTFFEGFVDRHEVFNCINSCVLGDIDLDRFSSSSSHNSGIYFITRNHKIGSTHDFQARTLQQMEESNLQAQTLQQTEESVEDLNSSYQIIDLDNVSASTDIWMRRILINFCKRHSFSVDQIPHSLGLGEATRDLVMPLQLVLHGIGYTETQSMQGGLSQCQAYRHAILRQLLEVGAQEWFGLSDNPESKKEFLLFDHESYNLSLTASKLLREQIRSET